MQRPKKNATTILKKAEQLFKKVSSNYTLEQVNSDFSSWIRTQNEFSGGEKAYNKIDENGDVYRQVSMAWPNKKKAPDDYFIPLIHPVTGKPCPVPERGWRNPPTTMKKMLENGLILFGKDETTIPNSKYLLKENMYENIPSLLYYGGSDTDLLSKMKIPFDTPKAISICQEHISSFTNENDIILDFFSGSATTAHAVMQLNAEDGGNRKFIMVQLPEKTDEKSEAFKAGYKNICEIGKERIRRAGKKIKESLEKDGMDIRHINKELQKGEQMILPTGEIVPKISARWGAGDETEDNKKIADSLDIGFRVLKLAETNMTDVYYSPLEINQQMLLEQIDNIKPDRNDLDLLFGCLIDWGIPLNMPYVSEKIDGFTVHTYNDGDLIACFDKNVSENVIKEIAKRQPLRAVFRDSSFADSPSKINVGEIFKMIAPDTRVRVI